MNSAIISCPSCKKKNRIPADKQHLQPKCGQCKAGIRMADNAVPVELGDHDFHEFIKSAVLPVMVDFFSPTCGPCKTMLPIVNAMARDHLGKCIIAKIDTSLNQQIARFFQIRGVPTFMFFNHGSLIDHISGAVPRNILEEKIKKL